MHSKVDIKTGSYVMDETQNTVRSISPTRGLGIRLNTDMHYIVWTKIKIKVEYANDKSRYYNNKYYLKINKMGI